MLSALSPGKKELIRQQVLLGQMRAAECLFRQQNNLRNILSQSVPLDSSLGNFPFVCGHGVNEEDEGGLGEMAPQQTMLLQQLLVLATQPSPVKATFGIQEMEVIHLMILCRNQKFDLF